MCSVAATFSWALRSKVWAPCKSAFNDFLAAEQFSYGTLVFANRGPFVPLVVPDVAALDAMGHRWTLTIRQSISLSGRLTKINTPSEDQHSYAKRGSQWSPAPTHQRVMSHSGGG
jgi:hypothetical protein